jgi:CheY-like chemotaxis protein
MMLEMLNAAGVSCELISDPDAVLAHVPDDGDTPWMCILDVDHVPNASERLHRLSAVLAERHHVTQILLTRRSTEEPLEGLRHPSRSIVLHKPLRRYQLLDAISDFRATPSGESVPTQVDPSIPLEGSRSIRILLVEDNQINQKVATLLLKRIGFEVDIAGNGIEAIRSAQRRFYPIILMDVQMPEMDGIQATREILDSAPAGQRPLILAMSAGVSHERKSQCKDAGMSGFVAKPVQLDELREHLDQAMETLGLKSRS